MLLQPIQGRVAYLFGDDDFDVDQIVGVKNIKQQDVEKLCDVAMARFDPNFRQTVRPGDVLVGGQNFGYGHPHYPAMRAMRHMGIAAVIAESFFPPYWNGEISMGFPQIVCPGITSAVERWDDIAIDWGAQELRLPGKGIALPIQAYSPTEARILEAGGFKRYLRQATHQES